MTTRHPEQFTDANFKSEVLGSDQPVLVDFWAEWCGPCRMLGPVVEELANEIGDGGKVGKLNVDENPQAAQEYGIQSIPSVLIFHNGEVVDRLVGVQSKQRYKEALRSTAVA